MTLGAVIEGLRPRKTEGDLETEIKGIVHDSRLVGPGDLFVALEGGRFDGRDFIGDAVGRGASAVIEEGPECTWAVPCVLVDDPREALAVVSDNFYLNPSGRLTVVGITGTNGKTTTSRILKSIFEADGRRTGLIGTINYVVGDRVIPAPYTTPEAVDFQRLLSEMLEAGCTHVVTEVSSHALSQKRVDRTRFGAAAFTNLTREHLDFHKDMESYFGAKRRLFDELLAGPAVINADDPYGARLLSGLSGRRLSYGLADGADLRAVDIRNTPDGLSFRMLFGGGSHEASSLLIGVPNVYNILAASGVALSLGVPMRSVISGVRGTGQVEGRFEKVDLGQGFLCVVDYAHTEDSLRRLVLTAREFTRGRVITVFGCGGDRDRGKRPRMGFEATELSDLVIITSDNPRGEDPDRIIGEISAGASRGVFRIVPDRKKAIAEAVAEAGPGDTVLIAGKGHEGYQEIKGRRYPFSDREEAERAIRGKIGRA